MARKAKPIEKVKFTAADIVMRSIDDLKPFPNNPKIHTPAQVDAIAANITAFGFDQPILIDENDTILKGHGRQLGARKAGLEVVPTIKRSGLSADDKWAIVISDNALPAMTGFDRKLLTVGLTQLAKVNYPLLSLTGFDQVRLAMFGVGGDAGIKGDPDAEQELKPPVSRKGDIWILDKTHRIICGDSTDKKVVEAVLDGAEPHLLLSDPPYGVDYDADWRNKAKRPDGTPYGASAVGRVGNDDNADWSEAWDLSPCDVAYIWHAGRHASVVQRSLESSGFEIRCQIIWAKQQFAIGRGDYHWKHEPCWYAVRKGRKGHWNGDRKQTTVWEINKPVKSETGHSTQKPIECMKRPIENNSAPGDSVYDPFLGSGTTLIAAAMTNRVCYGVEIAPEYVDVAVRRFMALTKKPATLQATGKSFDQVVRERAKKAA